ncbi:MAG: hypothetical protein ACI86S_001994 [Paracoccaceae bacterium]|jgi:hypothetical protein
MACDTAHDVLCGLENGGDFGPDDPGDLRAICKAERQRQAHIDDPRQHAVTFGHRRAWNIAPAIIPAGEPRRFGRAEPFKFHTTRQTACDDIAHGLGRPVEQ